MEGPGGVRDGCRLLLRARTRDEELLNGIEGAVHVRNRTETEGRGVENGEPGMSAGREDWSRLSGGPGPQYHINTCGPTCQLASWYPGHGQKWLHASSFTAFPFCPLLGHVFDSREMQAVELVPHCQPNWSAPGRTAVFLFRRTGENFGSMVQRSRRRSAMNSARLEE
jgi:hypothetical protein